MPEWTGNEPDWHHPGNRQCTTTKRNGQRCRAIACRGVNVCRVHGGFVPAVRAKGLQRWHETQAERQAIAILQRDGIQPLTDPVGELERSIAEYVTLKDIAAHKVNDLTEWRTTTKEGTEQIRAELTFYEKLLDQTTKRLIDLQKLGLAEKRITISALQAERAATAWTAMGTELFTRIRSGEPLDTIEADMPNMARRHLLGRDAA